MTTNQIKGMLRFHRAAYRAYKASGQTEQAAAAKRKMVDLYVMLRATR